MISARTGRSYVVSEFLHRHLLKLIVVSYGLAAAFPALGLWIKDAEVLDVGSPLGRITMTIPKLLLSLLLFNAGMKVGVARVGQMARRPGVILAGLATNLAVPLIFLAVMVPALRAWHNPDEAAVVLVGLALVTAMPIAGSSTGWAQAADGDMALSLGLVLGSTLLSPLTTPASLHALGSIAPGRYGVELHHLADRDTGAFLAAWVLLPSLLGIVARSALGEGRAEAVGRHLKVIAPVTLLVLCYANASSCLPQALGHPDWDFLGIILTFVTGLCVVTFSAGYVLGRLLRADRGQRAALMFGLGMNNNGTGLVLASLALGSQPMVMLPIIVYNLTQHLVAGCVDALLRRAGTDPGGDGVGGRGAGGPGPSVRIRGVRPRFEAEAVTSSASPS
jgi:BASS family bile acid:Na+ symporter